MKKVTIFLTFLTVLFCDGISGVSYFEYNNGDASLGEQHGFYMARTYLTYKYSISNDVSYEFQADIGKIKSTQGAPVEDEKLTMYLKKAQLDWKLNDKAKLSLGLIGMNMFNVQEKTWGNRFIEKSAMDQYGFSSSADLGFGFLYDFGSFSASMLITNGEGYKEEAADDHEKISLQFLYGENRLDKNDGYNVGLVYSTLNYDLTSTEEGNQAVTGLFTGWSGYGFTIGLDNSNLVTTIPGSVDVTSTISSFYMNYSINDILKVLAKYDNYDPNDDTVNTEDEETKTVFGLAWMPTKGLTICPNVTEISTYDGNGIEVDSDMLAINFQFKF